MKRRIPELIPVLGNQPAGDVSHKNGGRLGSRVLCMLNSGAEGPGF